MRLDYFLNQLKIENLSHNTLKNYEISIKKLEERLHSKREPKKEDVVAFLVDLKEKEYSPMSISRHLAAIKKYFEVVKEEKLLIKGPKVEHKERIYLTEEELKKILKKASEDEKAIIYFFYSTAARFAELEEANKSDLDLGNRKVKVIRKGGAEKYLYFTEKAGTLLEAYLKRRVDRNSALLVGYRGDRIANMYLNSVLKRLAKTCRINKNISPHTLRKSMGQHILEITGNIHLASKKLDHKRIETTQISYADFSPKESQERLEKLLSKHPEIV